jgi:hypothetical protein
LSLGLFAHSLLLIVTKSFYWESWFQPWAHQVPCMSESPGDSQDLLD